MLSRKQLTELRSARLTGPNKLPDAMTLAGLTQVQLAEAIGSTQSQISKLVSGSYSKLPIENARKFADFFGCAIEDIFPARETIAS